MSEEKDALDEALDRVHQNEYDKLLDNPEVMALLVADKPDTTLQILATAGTVAVVALIAWTIWRKRHWLRAKWDGFAFWLRAMLSGYAVWSIAVASYTLLVGPFGSYADSEELFDLVLWFLLPPLGVAAAVVWFRSYALRPKF